MLGTDDTVELQREVIKTGEMMMRRQRRVHKRKRTEEGVKGEIEFKHDK